MIAEKQLKNAIEKVVKKLLKKGSIPAQSTILAELKKVIPFPGKPTTRVAPQKNFTPVDTKAYNNFWTSVSDDLTLLYAQLYDHISGTAANVDRVFAWSSGINAAAKQLQSFIDNFDIDDRSIDNISLSFGDSSFIDLGADTYGSKTTAALDYKNGLVTLPINSKTFSNISLHNTSITGTPNTGKELKIIGNTLSNLVNDSTNIPWMTQVIDSGGGTSYTLVLSFANPVSISSCTVETTHKQAVSISYLLRTGKWTSIASNYSDETIQTDIKAIRIVLTRELGISKDDKFIYTFGISSINVRSQEYIQSAEFTSVKIPILTKGRRPAKINLVTTDTKPSGTDITYKISLYNEAGDLAFTKTNDVLADETIITTKDPLYLATAEKNAISIRETDQELSVADTTPHSIYRPGTDLFLKTLIDSNEANVTSDYSLLAEGNGVFIGECQWLVDHYEVDWSNLPNHIPGPMDWANLEENGFSANEITTVYSDINRSTDSVIMLGDDYGQISEWNLCFTKDFEFKYLHWELVLSGSPTTTVTINLKNPSEDLVATGSILTATIKPGKSNIITLVAYEGSGLSGTVTINKATTTDDASSNKLIMLNDRLDIIRGPIESVGFSDKTCYRYQTNFYSSNTFSITVPGNLVRESDSRFTALYNGLTDIVNIPAHQYDDNGANSDLFATVYLNDKRISKEQNGCTYNIKTGWNSLTVYIYCAKERSEPITLGISLTPQTYLLTDNSTVTNTGDFADLGIEFPLLDNVTTVNNIKVPQTYIKRVLAKKDRLQACSLFDLCWNTPILHKDRYTAELVYDTDEYKTNLYLPYTSTGRYTVYYDSVQPEAQTDLITSAVITATLTTSAETKTSRPSIEKIKAIFS